MNKKTKLAALASILILETALAADSTQYPPKTCEPCDFWNQPTEPFHILGNTWYVGTANLSSILLHSPKGAILLDGGLPQSAPLIAANIRKLGFRLEDIRIIVNSHAHYDHAGGLAQLQKASGARVYASPPSRQAFEHGEAMPDDPQFAFGTPHNSFPALRDVRTVKDGETLKVGPLAITAHFTPGHTPGGTTWSWRECEARGDKPRCVDVVYVDSLNSVSAPGFKFSGDTEHASLVESFGRSIDKVAALPCDLLLAPHTELMDFKGKLARRAADPSVNPFIDGAECRAYAQGARERLDKRLQEERAGAPATLPH
jgi:metallo-beta-lactamase class B